MWQLNEITTNIFLLSGALLNSIDDYLHGTTYRLPKPLSSVPFARKILSVAGRFNTASRWRRLRLTQRWKRQWNAEFGSFLLLFVRGILEPSDDLSRVAKKLISLLQQRLPDELQTYIIRIPSAFRKQDLTHFDILTLGRTFIEHFPDRRQPILVIGLRSAGSYFAPLLRALLISEGYQAVNLVTLRPNEPLAPHELAVLTQRPDDLAVLVDEPPVSGRSITAAVERVRRAGFSLNKLVILAPIRQIGRDWQTHVEASPLLDVQVLALQPEKWHKQFLLGAENVAERVQEYFTQREFTKISLIASPLADAFNAQLELTVSDPDRARLKHIYAVRLEARDGRVETHYVLAKSVGWGWFGYAAFLIASRLSGLVAPLLGLRDGILYTFWLPQPTGANKELPRQLLLEQIAEYVAARVRCLRLTADPMPALGLDSQHTGFDVLEKSLCKVYGTSPTAKLMSGRIRQRLSNACPVPTLIDGKMSPSEWIIGAGGVLKTDFEHHGFGKHELNVVDPAYDLADTILQFGLSLSEEKDFIGHYVRKTGDTGVTARLFMNKLMAGTWSMASALRLLKQPQLSDTSAKLNEQYNRAWDFLTLESMRFCGNMCSRPQSLAWRSPLVVLDIDGVLDRRHFGFPTTTAAGIRALSLLHSNGYAIAVDTARSAHEIKDYCVAYGFVGGVAEYGSFIYDAISNRELVLVGALEIEQLETLRRDLRKVPGVFLNDSYRYSIRAYTFGSEGTLPLPSLMVSSLISDLGLNRLRSFQTTIDTTIAAKDVDKGTGLEALISFVGHPNLETIAVGDSEPDLPMFHVAGRSFAPSHGDRRVIAEALGCRFAPNPFQLGLLSIAQSLVKTDGGHDKRWPLTVPNEPNNLFLDLLRVADEKRSTLFARALLSPAAFRIFISSP